MAKKLIEKKLIVICVILGGVLSAPLCADVYKTKREIRKQMVEHEKLSAIGQSALVQALDSARVFERRPVNGGMGISVSRDVLQALKPFAKTPGNPLFQECFFEAVSIGLIDDVRELVQFFGVDINAVGNCGTALHCLAFSSDHDYTEDMINFLIEKGAQLEAFGRIYCCRERITPLGLAATNAPVFGSKVVRAFLAHGAELLAVGGTGLTSADAASLAIGQMAGDSVLDLDEELEGEPAGVPYYH